jgi:endonuclease/exonuclease/phosphatase (EEP) superfamily protein YafD
MKSNNNTFKMAVKRMLSGLSFLSWLSLWLFGLGVLLSYAMRWWPGDGFLSVRFINYFMPWLLVVLVPGFVFAWLAHKKWLGATLSVPILIICLTYLPLLLNCTQSAVADGLSLKVMSYNVCSKNRNLTEAAKLIMEEQPDILLLQEIGTDGFQGFLDNLHGLYGDKQMLFDYVPEMEQAVISPYPIKRLEVDWKKGRAQKVRLETPFGQFIVFNIHAFNFGWLRRHRHMTTLLQEDILTTRDPIILGGDFNTSDQTQTYRMVSRYLKNAHRECGCGFGFTFPASAFRLKGRFPLPAIIRIDHLFFSHHFSLGRARVLNESGGSDHFPVVAEVTID